MECLAYTDSDVASLLRVSKRTVYRLRKSGALRAIRMGRAVRIPAEEISRLLATKQEHKENANAGQGPRIHPQQ
jgi:excisionase family DNA binding protein